MVLVFMVTKMLRGHAGLVLAIASDCRPGELEWQENEQEDGKPATHDGHCNRVLSEARCAVKFRCHACELAFRMRRPLATTNRLAPMSANTAIHIVALPKTARPKNTALMPKAKAMFCQSTA